MIYNTAEFPKLETEGYEDKSLETTVYNCIAFAVGDTLNNWWPHPDAVWPKEVPNRETVYAFIRLFKNFGYESCKDGSFEHGFEKVAIYALNNVPTHATRQSGNGQWISKIGDNMDIEHKTLSALEGPIYGEPVRYLKRPIESS